MARRGFATAAEWVICHLISQGMQQDPGEMGQGQGSVPPQCSSNPSLMNTGSPGRTHTART